MCVLRRQALNRAVLGRAGVASDDAAPAVLTQAFDGIGQEFNTLARQTTINVDRQLGQDIVNTAQNYGRRLHSPAAEGE